MTKRIAVGGSAANPSHLGHRILIEKALDSGKFDEVIWIPSGVRPDKEEMIDPNHRVAITMLTFPQEWLYRKKTIFRINFQDVYGFNQRTFDWLIKINQENPDAEVIWFTGVDSVVPQERFHGKCEIEATWFFGDILMAKKQFCIIPRKGYPHPRELSLPLQFEILDVEVPEISSTELRDLIRQGKPFGHLVVPEVAEYIKRFGLYGWKGEKDGEVSSRRRR